MTTNLAESSGLAQAVHQLATAVHTLSDADLGQPFQWRKHDEGVRLAIFGTAQELHELSTSIRQSRLELQQPMTAVQQLLGLKTSGFRDLQAVFFGITEAEFDQEPAPAEWSLRTVLGHIVGAERWFFTLAYLGLQHYQASTTPPPLSDEDPEKIVDSNEGFSKFRESCALPELWAYYEQLHGRILNTFSDLTDEALQAPTPLWWEEETYPIQYRLLRLDAHLQQHLIQAEKTCDQIGKTQSESRRLVRLLLAALAEVEGLLLGTADLCRPEQATLARQISQRSQQITAVIKQTRSLETAVKTGDLTQVQSILKENPALVDAIDQNQLPLVLTATYHRQSAVAEILLEGGAYLSIFSAAATGKLNRVQEIIKDWPGWLNEIGRDGFSPLQLACFFGHEETALWLIEQKAEVNAVAQNDFKIAPIHAASSNNNMVIAQALLENGANVNAKQIAGITPLHQAAHANNVDMIRLYLEYGADPTLTNDDGHTPLQQAISDGNQNAIKLLEAVGTS